MEILEDGLYQMVPYLFLAGEICNKSVIKLRKGYNLNDVRKIMTEKLISVIPIVDGKK